MLAWGTCYRSVGENMHIRQVIVQETTHSNENTWDSVLKEQHYPLRIVVVQSLSPVPLCNPMDGSIPGYLVLHHVPKLAETHVHWVSDAIQKSCPLSFPSPSAFNLSQHQGPFHELAFLIRWPKYWSFRFSISSSKEYSGLIFFRMDWLDLLAVQGTLKCLLQHHSSKASILQSSAFFIVQLSHLYMTTGKTTALTRQAFVSKVTSLLPTSLCYSAPSSAFLGRAGLPRGLGACGALPLECSSSHSWLQISAPGSRTPAVGHLKNSLALCPSARDHLICFILLRALAPISNHLLVDLSSQNESSLRPWTSLFHLLSLQGQADAWTTLAPVWFCPSRVLWVLLRVTVGTNPLCLAGPCLQPHCCLRNTAAWTCFFLASKSPSAASGRRWESQGPGPQA